MGSTAHSQLLVFRCSAGPECSLLSWLRVVQAQLLSCTVQCLLWYQDLRQRTQCGADGDEDDEEEGGVHVELEDVLESITRRMMKSELEDFELVSALLPYFLQLRVHLCFLRCSPFLALSALSLLTSGPLVSTGQICRLLLSLQCWGEEQHLRYPGARGVWGSDGVQLH